MIVKKGSYGLVTQSGAVIKSVIFSGNIDPGAPVKLNAKGQAESFTTGDTAAKLFGIKIKDSSGSDLNTDNSMASVLTEGYIHVKVDKDAATANPYLRNGPVFYDTTKHAFTSDPTKIAISAKFAVDGLADDVAEIQLIPFVGVKVA